MFLSGVESNHPRPLFCGGSKPPTYAEVHILRDGWHWSPYESSDRSDFRKKERLSEDSPLLYKII